MAKVIESGSLRWKPHHYQLMIDNEETDTRTPVSIEGDMNWTQI